MVVLVRFGALPLLPPGFASSDARAMGHLFANDLRQSYLYAQSQGRHVGIQTYLERHFDEVQRSIGVTDYHPITVLRKRLPPWARTVGASVKYSLANFTGTARVFHRMTLSFGADTDVGPESIKEFDVTSAPLRIDIGTDYDDADPGVTGVFGKYDLPMHDGECFAEVENVDTSDTNNVVVIAVEAYAYRSDNFSVTSSSSSRTSNLVTAVVPEGHGFTIGGTTLWTSGFDFDVPEGSPVDVDSTTQNTVSWVLEGDDDADFGWDGTITSGQGIPIQYRPAIVSAWWET